jgi:hypothetical protein
MAQCLRHLSKREPVTKLKALQALRAHTKSKPAAESIAALGPWSHLYGKLVMDSSRAVRTEAAATLGDLVSAAGKAAAALLKSLLPPWWLAQFDPHPDAAAAARSAFQVRSSSGVQLQAQLLLAACERSFSVALISWLITLHDVWQVLLMMQQHQQEQ